MTVGEALGPLVKRWPECASWAERLGHYDARAVADAVSAAVGPDSLIEEAGPPPDFVDFLDTVEIIERAASVVRSGVVDELAHAVMEELPSSARPGGATRDERARRSGVWHQAQSFVSRSTVEAGPPEQLWRFGVLVSGLRGLGEPSPCPELDGWVEASSEGLGAVRGRVAAERGGDDVLGLPAAVRWEHLARVLLAGFRGQERPVVPSGWRFPSEPARSLLNALLARHEGDGVVKLPGWMRLVAEALPRAVSAEGDVYDPEMQAAADDAHRDLVARGRAPVAAEIRGELGRAILSSARRGVVSLR